MKEGRTKPLRLHWLGMLLLGLLALLLMNFGFALAQETKETETKKPWTGKLADGRDIAEADLEQIIKAHELWLGGEFYKREFKGGKQADLRGAKLAGANLSWANLKRANLGGADLDQTNLSEASLVEVNLSEASMIGANLSRANLLLTNLSRANLWVAHLSGADLTMANLSGANLHFANLNGAVFEPKPGTVSDVLLLLDILGLSSLRYEQSSHGLVELRETYKKAGLREPERELTYALNHNRRDKLWKEGGFLGKLESLFQLICFEWTCQYGMNPGRSLEILFLGLFFFTFPYLLALRSRDRETGLWLVLPPDRILGGSTKVRPFKLTGHTPFRPLPAGRWSRFKARLCRSLRRVRLAFYFSALSAFNLGWRELNVGNWISRLQKHEYTLRATGWPRTVAGLQSLLSVYLLALWVLTYFGRPFD